MTLKETDLDATVSWTVERASQGHGIALCFDSVLADGVALTNRPGAPRLIYRQAFFPWPSPLDVCPGDTVSVKVSDRLVGDIHVWRWDTQHTSKNASNGAKPPSATLSLVPIFLSPNCGLRHREFQPKLNEDGQDSTPHLVAHGRDHIARRDLARSDGNPGRFKRWQDAFNLVSSI